MTNLGLIKNIESIMDNKCRFNFYVKKKFFKFFITIQIDDVIQIINIQFRSRKMCIYIDDLEVESYNQDKYNYFVISYKQLNRILVKVLNYITKAKLENS